MKARKDVCANCPFRSDSTRGFLATYTPESLLQIVLNEVPFPCHMTQATQLTIMQAMTQDKYPLCRGALVLMKKSGKLPRDKELGQLVQAVDGADYPDIMDAQTFLKHHTIDFTQLRNMNAKRTPEEIKRQVDGLNEMKKRLPPVSRLGTENHEHIDAQIAVLTGKGIAAFYYIEESSPDYEDGDNDTYFEAEQAQEWLHGRREDDLFETE